jgi:oligopeptide/dipeptide ABC transporter ATP-binding protein
LPGRTLVLYAGRCVEEGPVDAVLDRPLHPYTAALMDCIPGKAADLSRPLRPLPGRLPRPGDELDGCPFAPRCTRAGVECEELPAPVSLGGRTLSCHHPEES